jgi:hypothetical protein
MAEIEITLPTVQYGNVKVRATAEELGLEGVQDAGALGVATAVYLNLFTQGFKVGTRIDVDYSGGVTKPPSPAPIERVEERTIRQVMSDEDVDTEAEAVALIKSGLGATELGDDYVPDSAESSDDAPWNSPTVDAKPKPWETGTTAPTNAVKVAEIDW